MTTTARATSKWAMSLTRSTLGLLVEDRLRQLTEEDNDSTISRRSDMLGRRWPPSERPPLCSRPSTPTLLLGIEAGQADRDL